MTIDAPRTKGLHGWLAVAASPRIVFYAVPWLMILLTLGTVAQKELGLYVAQAVYFSSWILWLGPVPLPGAYLTLAIITLCLLVKFLFFSVWRWAQAGIILTHLGVLILLIGGGLTAASQKEGFIAIGEGSEMRTVSDYHSRILRITRDESVVADLDFGDLQKGMLPLNLPFKVRIDSLCTNCVPAPLKDDTGRKGLAAEIALRDSPPEKDAETNLSGLTFTVSDAEEESNGTYLAMEEIPHTPEIETQGDTYKFAMMREQRPLPFGIALIDFKRDVYPGTDMASGFSSAVEIRDGGMVWPATISMNEPLRYKGYTIYQASFSQRPDGEFSVLSVVENHGRMFPYLSSAVIFAGLLLQLLLRLKSARRAA